MNELAGSDADRWARFEALTLEARELRRQRDAARLPADRAVIERQLRDIERRIEALQKLARHG